VNHDSPTVPDVRTGVRRRPWRSLNLVSHGQTFLRRRGLSFGGGNAFGVNIHFIDGPDPGPDLHDHPWWFCTIILRGGYLEEAAKTTVFDAAYAHNMGVTPLVRQWKRWSIHKMPLHVVHRIIHADAGTVTLMFHGPKRRIPWGFYAPTGWVSQHDYDYETRRPCVEERP
jgi:hypothetical protein